MLNNNNVIFTSPELKKITGIKHKNFYYVRNACEFKYFNDIYINKRFCKNKRLAKDVIGYYGAISDWFDVELVEMLVKTFDNYDFHLVGNVFCNNKEKTKRIKSLNRFKNVTLFGEVPYGELAKYVSKFKVGIIPFLKNDLIKCTNPVKLYEMLAVGLPVVLTELEDVKTWKIDDIFYLSKNRDEFIKNLKIALNEEYQENDYLINKG
jgi:glycosyltransferase involved in cell wall biosynthesis